MNAPLSDEKRLTLAKTIQSAAVYIDDNKFNTSPSDQERFSMMQHIEALHDVAVALAGRNYAAIYGDDQP